MKPPSGRLGFTPGPKKVLSSQHSQVFLGPPTPGELGEEGWIGGHVFQPDGSRADPVEIAPDADVMDSGDIPDMFDVVSHVTQGGPGRIRSGLASDEISIGQATRPA